MDGRNAATVGQRVRDLRLIPPPAAPAAPGSDRPRLLHTTFAPFTGEPLAELTLTAPAGVGAAFDAAREAQRHWAARPLRERAAVFLRFHDLVLARQAEVLDLIQLETGKARKHAFEEVADVAIVSRHYARAARQYLGPTRRRGLFPVATRVDELHHPKGVVGIVSPWNYPLTLAVSDAIPAFLAGNAVVHKPDTQTALTAMWARRLLVEAGLPEQLWQIVLGDGPVIGSAVVDQADYVSFTGSTAVGRQIAQRCAARLVGCSLELGGKNPFVVLDDAPLDRAVEAAVRACFSSAGQLCISMERMLVSEDVYDAFLDRFLRRVKAMRLGTGLDFTADMGSLVSTRQLEAVGRHVDDARDKGARILAGGRARPDIGPLFYEPTVLSGVTPDMEVCADETFGPVVAVSSFRDDEEAVTRANDTVYGLNAAVWTSNLARGRRVGAAIKAGTVNVNEAYGAAWGSVAAPMGGMKDSGLGRRHGAEGIQKYTEAQTIATQRFLRFGAPDSLTDEQWTRVLSASLRTMKALGLR
jgi:succinate-semialdehyde dehydrogenase / glutarate-semialdehyde dehydrogenase